MDSIRKVNDIFDEVISRLDPSIDESAFTVPASAVETPYPSGPLGAAAVPVVPVDSDGDFDGDIDELGMVDGLDAVDVYELGPQVAAFDDYIEQVITSLTNALGVADDDAWSILLDFAGRLHDDSVLPEFPESDDGEELVAWLSAANSIGFGDLVLKYGDGDTVEIGINGE
jgi:hypothetical protein